MSTKMFSRTFQRGTWKSYRTPNWFCSRFIYA